MPGIADHAAVRVGAEVKVGICPVRLPRRPGNAIQADQLRTAGQHDRGGEAVSVAAWHRIISDLGPQRLERMLGKMHSHSVIFIVVPGHELAKIMTAATAPDDSDFEGLGAQRVQDGSRDGLVQRYRQVEVPGSETAVLGSRPER